MEEAALPVGDVVGHGPIVMFLDSRAKVSELVEKGVVIQNTFTTVSPLTNPATTVMISNAPPFFKNESVGNQQLSALGFFLFY